MVNSDSLNKLNCAIDSKLDTVIDKYVNGDEDALKVIYMMLGIKSSINNISYFSRTTELSSSIMDKMKEIDFSKIDFNSALAKMKVV